MAIPELTKQIPNAKLIVLLRDPIELAVSMHAQNLSVRDETIRSFEKAWRNCERRRQGERIPGTCPDAKILLYDEIPLLGGQLERVLNHVSRENIRWWFHGDFSRDPGRIYREVLVFLEVDDDARQEFPRINARKHTRSFPLAAFTQKPPKWVRQGAPWFKKRAGVKRLGVMNALRRINYGAGSTSALSPALLAEMRAYFAPDVCLLQTLTGRDLHNWLPGDNTNARTPGDASVQGKWA